MYIQSCPTPDPVYSNLGGRISNIGIGKILIFDIMGLPVAVNLNLRFIILNMECL